MVSILMSLLDCSTPCHITYQLLGAYDAGRSWGVARLLSILATSPWSGVKLRISDKRPLSTIVALLYVWDRLGIQNLSCGVPDFTLLCLASVGHDSGHCAWARCWTCGLVESVIERLMRWHRRIKWKLVFEFQNYLKSEDKTSRTMLNRYLQCKLSCKLLDCTEYILARSVQNASHTVGTFGNCLSATMED